MLIRFVGAACAVAAFSPTQDAPVSGLPDLEPPFVVEAGGVAIQVTTGHAAPFLVDLDQDGVKDLVVGQFGEGRARVYRNVGTDAEPRFEDFTWLEAGGEPAAVPPS